MHYMSTDFGADSSSHFIFTAWIDRQTHRQGNPMNALSTPAAIQLEWVTTSRPMMTCSKNVV